MVVTQQIIDLYDAFTHGALDRRSFMARLVQLSGSIASAAALLPLLAANRAAASIVAAGDARLDGGRTGFPGSGGEVSGYLARPKGAGPLPAVIVIHENRGLNAHIEDVARRLALEGFLALAPDFLSPAGGTPADEDAARDLIGKLDGARTLQNLLAARTFLSRHPQGNGRVGAVGFCWGGGKVGELAVHDPQLNAGVVYYGRQPDSADVAKIRAPLQLHYAGLDERINAGIPAFEKALIEADKKYELFIYDGANHAFNNDTSAARYDKAAAELAWSRTVGFFREHLRG
jgi:carboxymethylenebutenolidase